MKLFKIALPTMFALAVMALAVPGAKAISADDFFDQLKNQYGNRVVAFYESGLHGVVGEEGFNHEGIDLVVEDSNGCKNKFIQWFWGRSGEKNGFFDGDKSIWEITNYNSCPHGEILVKDAYPKWGDYFKPGADYCVKTTDFIINN